MIRPVTCLAVLLACGSGLYLYQSKHRVKVLDDQIAQTVKATDALREQTRMLSAEWTLLNDPERLRQLANQFLTLQTVEPSQFTSLADLDSRLPMPVPPGAPGGTGGATAAPPGPVPVASDGSTRIGEDAGKPASAGLAEAAPAASPKDALPPAQVGPPRIAMAAALQAPHPAERKPPMPRTMQPQPRFAAGQPRPPVRHGAGPRGIEPRNPEPRLAEQQPMVPARRGFALVRRVSVPEPLPRAGGSLLGMAHDMGSPPAPLPLPRPMPVSAPQLTYSGGG